jgi:hypothetical protein
MVIGGKENEVISGQHMCDQTSCFFIDSCSENGGTL